MKNIKMQPQAEEKKLLESQRTKPGPIRKKLPTTKLNRALTTAGGLKQAKDQKEKKVDLEETNQVQWMISKYLKRKDPTKKIGVLKKNLRDDFEKKLFKEKYLIKTESVVQCSAIDKQGTTLFLGDQDGQIKIYSRNGIGDKFKHEERLSTDDKTIFDLCIAKNGDLLFSASKNHKVSVWKRVLGTKYTLNQTMDDHKSEVNAVRSRSHR